MKLVVVGLSHKTASLGLREKIAFNQEQVRDLLALLLQQTEANEVVVLSTCNRTEIYADLSDTADVVRTLSEFSGSELKDLVDVLYEYQGQAAIKHMMKVACGMDSLVIGEEQILGQMKQAFLLAEQSGSVGKCFCNLFPEIFQLGKKVQKTISMGFCPASIASLFVDLAKQKLDGALEGTKILLIGSGRTMKLSGQYLQKEGADELFIASRHLESAEKLAEELGAKAIEFAEISDVLTEVDAVFAATASSVPVLKKEHLVKRLNQEEFLPLLLFDLGVPRDIDPEIELLQSVELYTIDSLQERIAQFHGQKNHAMDRAYELIEKQAKSSAEKLQDQQVDLTISAFRNHANRMKEKELEKALKLLQRGAEPEEVLFHFANGLTNKILHKPSKSLRKADKEKHRDILLRIYELFAGNASS